MEFFTLNWWHTIVGLSILLITLIYDLYTDTKAGRIVNHVRGWWLRWIGFVPAFLFLGPWALGLVFTYWMLFDSGYGLIRKLGFFYVGTTARLDILQRHYPIIHVLKYLLGIAGPIIYGRH